MLWSSSPTTKGPSVWPCDNNLIRSNWAALIFQYEQKPLHHPIKINDDRIIGNILSGSDALVTFNASGKQPICLTLISDPQWLVMAVLDQCFGDYPGTKLSRAVLGHNYVVEWNAEHRSIIRLIFQIPWLKNWPFLHGAACKQYSDWQKHLWRFWPRLKKKFFPSLQGSPIQPYLDR